jgi:hypothetical protein
MARKRMLQTFKEAAQRGPYDDYPVLPPEVDPQLYLSRNDRPQPFFLVCEKDTVLVQMSGSGKVEFRESPVRWWAAVPGDFVYVPARTPHRIVPSEESVHYRYKARQSGLEAAVWYCLGCDRRLTSHTWDTTQTLSQSGFLEAVRAFNESAAHRRCAECGCEHPEIDLEPYRWAEIVAELQAENA